MVKTAALAVLIAAAVCRPAESFAQRVEGGAEDVIVGSMLGAYSGATLGLLGGLMPCNRTLAGRRCAIVTTTVGGAAGMTMGGIIGARDTGQLHLRLENGGVGVLIGAAVGVGLRRAVRQYDWADVGAAAFLGGAIGASPKGVLIGLPVGALAGAVLWGVRPKSGLQDFVLLAMLGGAVGGLYDWADGVGSARGPANAVLGPAFSIPVRW